MLQISHILKIFSKKRVTFYPPAAFYITEAQNRPLQRHNKCVPAKWEGKEVCKMKFKRASAAVLAAALSASSMGIYSFAEEDAAMKTALTYVKQRIDIPETFTEFSYRTSTDNNSTQYRFTWRENNDNGSNGSISVNITGKVIKSVNIYKPAETSADDDVWIEESSSSFAKLSDAMIRKACMKYIKEINPSIYKDLKVNEDSLYISLWGSDATLSFARTYNGIPVTNQSGSVTVNKDTGELIRYNLYWTNGAGFSDAKDAISVEKAQAAYKSLFPIEKVYTLEYDWENKKYIPHLIYRQTKTGQINAFTGKLSTFDDYGSYDNGSDDVAAVEMETADIADDDADVNPTAGAGKAVTFSADEVAKLEKEGTLIKADDALKKLRDMNIFSIPAQAEVTYQNCYFNEQLGYYIRDIQFTGKDKRYIDLNGEEKILAVDAAGLDLPEEYNIWGSFSINAETGDLRSFYSNSYDNGSSMDESYDKKANEIFAKLLDKNFKDDFGTVEKTYESKVYSKYDSNTGKPVGDPRITSKTYSANRKAYDITCINENVSLTIANTGYVTSFSSTYRPDVTYPKPENIISANKAYKNFFKEVPPELKYRCAYRTDTKKVVTALVYSTERTLLIDAFTGKRVNYNGSVYNENEDKGDYTDLENSKYKKYAEKLKKYGITLMDKSGKLSENETITAEDFRFLLGWLGNYNTYRTVKAVKNDEKLSRQTAAYIIVSSKYGDEIPNIKDLFKAKFSDVPEDSKYFGYIVLADAAGLLEGSGDKFAPTAAFTRGEALKFIYSVLSK